MIRELRLHNTKGRRQLPAGTPLSASRPASTVNRTELTKMKMLIGLGVDDNLRISYQTVSMKQAQRRYPIVTINGLRTHRQAVSS